MVAGVDGLHEVTVIGGPGLGTSVVTVDGRPVNARSVTMHAEVGSVPQVVIEAFAARPSRSPGSWTLSNR